MSREHYFRQLIQQERQYWSFNLDGPDDSGNSGDRVLEAFYLDCRIRNLRPDTLRCYSERLRYLIRSCRKSILTIGKQDILNYIKTLIETGDSPYTINGRLRVYRLFYSWAVHEKLIDESPIIGIRFLKVDEPPPHILTIQQVQKVLSAFNTYKFEGSRNRNIILVLFDSWIRSGELVRIKLKDIDLIEGVIQINHSKSRRNRLVPISHRTCRAINTYLVKFRHGIDGAYLFPYRTGARIQDGQLTTILGRVGRRLGFKVSPHRFRHSGATEAAKQGMSPYLIKRQLGHASMMMTDRYIHAAERDVKEQHNKYSPVTLLKL